MSTQEHPAAFRSTQNHPAAPRSTQEHPGAPSSTQEHPEAPRSGPCGASFHILDTEQLGKLYPSAKKTILNPNCF